MASERAVTLQDIADRLGITRSTASYAITGRGRVSDATRHRVLEAARELGYQPNVAARRLRAARTGMIALCLPRSTTGMSYYMEATFGVVEEAERCGLAVSMLPSGHASARLHHRFRADGAILLDPTVDDPWAMTLLSGETPVVTGEPVPPGLPAPRGDVRSDHATAMAELMDHLAERGARRPALILPDLGMHWCATIRQAFETWCTRHHRTARVVSMPHPPKPEGIHAVTAALLATDTAPVDAVIAASDGTVLSVVTSAQRLGRRVGDDLLVAAAVDSDVLELTRPSVTAIDLHPREFGRRCVRALIEVLAGDDTGAPARAVHDTVPLTLHRRESTRGAVRDGRS